MITKGLTDAVGALERKRQVLSRGRDGTPLLKAAFVRAGITTRLSSLPQCLGVEVFSRGVAGSLDPPKPGQGKHEVSCPDRKAGLDPLRRSRKSSREHLKQPVALPTPASNFPSKLAAGPAFRSSPGLGRASPRMQRLCGSLGFDTVCLAPALPALSLAGKRKCCFSCCSQTRAAADG